MTAPLRVYRRIRDAAQDVESHTPRNPDPTVDVPVIWPCRTGPRGGMRWIVATIPAMGERLRQMPDCD